ncbi:hypothetical protein ACOMHN_031187 [Nucella lapillus]
MLGSDFCLTIMYHAGLRPLPDDPVPCWAQTLPASLHTFTEGGDWSVIGGDWSVIGGDWSVIGGDWSVIATPCIRSQRAVTGL